MKPSDLARLIVEAPTTNLHITAPDEIGLQFILDNPLRQIAEPEDIHYHDAAAITVEKARQIEQEARRAPRASSDRQHFVIRRLQLLPTQSAGPLLKAVEEAKFARFIFQAQGTPEKTRTLKSRCTHVELPFLTRRVVLGNMKALSLDARTARDLGLYDGTLAGTTRALNMKDTLAEIRRSLANGTRGAAALFTPEVLGSLAFDAAAYEHLDEAEQAYLQRDKNPARQKLALYRALRRQEG